MLEIRNLSFQYARRSPMVLQGVDLDLKDGEIGILLGKGLNIDEGTAGCENDG